MIENDSDSSGSTNNVKTPEEKLWFNVLSLGIRDFVESDVTHDKYYAISWLYKSEKIVGSFTWICHMLGLNEDAFREELLKYKRRYKSIFIKRSNK